MANEARHGLSSIAERFPGEQHAREGNRPDGRPYNFAGPGTNLARRLDRITRTPRARFAPINSIDQAGLRHDLQYEQIAEDYYRNPTPENKKRQLKRVHNEDDIFIDTVKRHRLEDPRVADLAAAAITGKKWLEKIPYFGNKFSRKYSGFGNKPRINIVDTTNDPVHKLREIAKRQNKNYEQKGGFLPAFLIPILASAGSTLVGKIYDTIKEKIEKKAKDQEGKGVKLAHKTIKQKRKFLMHLAKHVN